MLLLNESILKGLHQKTKEEEEVNKEVVQSSILLKSKKNPTVKALGWEAVKYMPSLSNVVTSWIKNEKIRRTLQSDIVKNLVNLTAARLL